MPLHVSQSNADLFVMSSLHLSKEREGSKKEVSKKEVSKKEVSKKEGTGYLYQRYLVFLKHPQSSSGKSWFRDRLVS